MATQDKQEHKRRVRTYRGFAAIIVGVLVLIVAVVRDDENSWQGLLLGGLCLAFGAAWLRRALRR